MTDETGLFLKAIHFAAHKHKNHRRKDRKRTPYINHPIGVAMILNETANINDQHILAAAVLHDTLEDTDTTFQELSETFSVKIATIVKEVSDDKSLPRNIRKQRQIETAPSLSYEARLIRIADKINNLHDITFSPPVFWSKKELKSYQDWALEVVNSIRGTNTELEKLFDETLNRARK
ncbi:MAG: HD domain-containing protein [Bacteroidota bacterium]